MDRDSSPGLGPQAWFSTWMTAHLGKEDGTLLSYLKAQQTKNTHFLFLVSRKTSWVWGDFGSCDRARVPKILTGSPRPRRGCREGGLLKVPAVRTPSKVTSTRFWGERWGFFGSGNSQSFKNINHRKTNQKLLFEHPLCVSPWLTEEMEACHSAVYFNSPARRGL